MLLTEEICQLGSVALYNIFQISKKTPGVLFYGISLKLLYGTFRCT